MIDGNANRIINPFVMVAWGFVEPFKYSVTSSPPRFVTQRLSDASIAQYPGNSMPFRITEVLWFGRGRIQKPNPCHLRS